MTDKKIPHSEAGHQNNAGDYIETNGTCVAISTKGICLAGIPEINKDCWFPLSKLVIEPLMPEKGDKVYAKIPKWLFDAKVAEAKANAIVRYSDHIRIKGYCIHLTSLAYIVFCDVDNEKRPFAKSKVIKIEEGGGVNQPITLVVPAWMVKRGSGQLPTWVAEVLA